MSSITDEVLKRYGNLVPQQKRLVRSLNEDKTDEELARMHGLQPVHIGELVQRVSEQLGLPKLASHYAQKQLLAEVERRYVLMQTQPQELGVKETSHTESTHDASAVQEVGPQTQLFTPKPQAATPGVEDLLPKVERLKKIHLETLGALEKFGYRDTSGMAGSLGIGIQSVYNRLNSICDKLDIGHLDLREAKLLLYQVMTRRRAIQEVKIAEGRATGAQDNPGLAKLPSPVEEVEAFVPLEHAPVSELSTSAEPAQHAPHVAGTSASPGVVIQLPSDVVDIDVVTGTFNGSAPSRDMAQEVRQRKERGLKPTFLVLSPMQGDPTTTLAQVVFLERDK